MSSRTQMGHHGPHGFDEEPRHYAQTAVEPETLVENVLHFKCEAFAVATPDAQKVVRVGDIRLEGSVVREKECCQVLELYLAKGLLLDAIFTRGVVDDQPQLPGAARDKLLRHDAEPKHPLALLGGSAATIAQVQPTMRPLLSNRRCFGSSL